MYLLQFWYALLYEIQSSKVTGRVILHNSDMLQEGIFHFIHYAYFKRLEVWKPYIFQKGYRINVPNFSNKKKCAYDPDILAEMRYFPVGDIRALPLHLYLPYSFILLLLVVGLNHVENSHSPKWHRISRLSGGIIRLISLCIRTHPGN